MLKGKCEALHGDKEVLRGHIMKKTFVTKIRYRATNTVDLVIFAGLNFHNCFILRIFMKIRIHKFPVFSSSAIIIIIFARFLNSRISPPGKIREN